MAFTDDDIYEEYSRSLEHEIRGLSGIVGDVLDGMGEATNVGFEMYPDIRFTVQVSGGAQLVRNWKNISAALRERASEFTVRSAYAIINESGDEVPVKTGRLKSVAYVLVLSQDTSKNPRMFDVGYDLDLAEQRGFDAADENYASKQHWDESIDHPHGGKARFLIDPFTRWSDKYPTGLSEELTQAVAEESAKAEASVRAGSRVVAGARLVKKVAAPPMGVKAPPKDLFELDEDAFRASIATFGQRLKSRRYPKGKKS